MSKKIVIFNFGINLKTETKLIKLNLAKSSRSMEKFPKEILWIIFENLLMETSIKLGRKSLYNFTFSIYSITGKLTTELMCICKIFHRVIVCNSSCKNGNLRFVARDYIVNHSIVATLYIEKNWNVDGEIRREWSQFESAHDGKCIRHTNIMIRPIQEVEHLKRIIFSFVLDGKEQVDGENLLVECSSVGFYALLQRLAK